ncbi:MAG TPA: SAM-dependent methyltransferase [Acidimicrobiales bacterium]
MPSPRRFVALVDRLQNEHPHITDPVAAIAAGAIRVDGAVMTNPRGLVRRDSALSVARPGSPRGAPKLRAAFEAFGGPTAGAVALDVGASTGGFTAELLAWGVARVYAVDAGHGQLLGSLRQDRRVINLERTNLGDLSRDVVPDVLGLVTIDVSYVSLATAIPQVSRSVDLGGEARLVALVKPMFELGLARPPDTEVVLTAALERAVGGMEAAGWMVSQTMRSPALGRHGAIEFLVHAHWAGPWCDLSPSDGPGQGAEGTGWGR